MGVSKSKRVNPVLDSIGVNSLRLGDLHIICEKLLFLLFFKKHCKNDCEFIYKLIEIFQ